jgi:hypothetical protein
MWYDEVKLYRYGSGFSQSTGKKKSIIFKPLRSPEPEFVNVYVNLGIGIDSKDRFRQSM